MSTNIKKHKIKAFIKALQYQYCHQHEHLHEQNGQ